MARPRVALLAAFLVLVVVTAVIGRRLAVLSHSSLSCVVEDNRSGGGSGIRVWAERMGYSTFPLRTPLREIEHELPQPGNCLITAGNQSWNPRGEEFTNDDWFTISKWIRAGNTLIVITSSSSSLPTSIKEHFTTHQFTAELGKETHPSFESYARASISTNPLEYELVPTSWGGELSVQADGPRLKDIPPELHLAGRGNASVLAGRALDQGMIYLLLDDSAWTNGGFDRADNAATLARILAQNLEPVGVLAFDEYRHGYGRVESFTTFFLSLPAAKDFAWMALVWGLFWLWSSTRRLSPPDEYQDSERRTAMEYIESVAAMNQRARAAPLAVKAVLQRVRYLLQKRGIIDEAANSVLDRAARHVESAERPAIPKKGITLVSELIQLRRKLYGTRPGPRAD